MKGSVVLVGSESVQSEAPLEAPLEEQVEAPLFQAGGLESRGLDAKLGQMQSLEAPLEDGFEAPLWNAEAAPLEEPGYCLVVADT